MRPEWIAACLFVFAFPTSAYGYLDPGTGSLIIQGIIGSIAVAGFTIRLYWHKFKALLTPGRDPADESPEEVESKKAQPTTPNNDEQSS